MIQAMLILSGTPGNCGDIYTEWRKGEKRGQAINERLPIPPTTTVMMIIDKDVCTESKSLVKSYYFLLLKARHVHWCHLVKDRG